jgi:hypothetical protein
MSGQILISYRRDESGGRSGRLCDRLRRDFNRKRIFIDVDSIAVAVNFVNVLKLRSRASMPKATDPPEDLKTVVHRNALRIADASLNDDCKRLTAAIKRDSRDSLSVALFVVLASILLVGSIWFAVAARWG